MTKTRRGAAGLAPQRLEDVPTERLRPHPNNPNQGDVGAIVDSIHENGFYGVIVAQKATSRILAGEHRWRAAREAGLVRVPVMWLDCDDDAALRVLLADNRTAELGLRDETKLHELLMQLIDTPDGLAGTGYDPDFLDSLAADLDTKMGEVLDAIAPEPSAEDPKPDDEDDQDADIPEADRLALEWKTARGQVWRLTAPDGTAHYAACIDSFAPDQRAELLGLIDGAPIVLGLHDPPYGIGAAKKSSSWVGYGGGEWKGGKKFQAAQRNYAPVIWDGAAFDPAALRGLSAVEVWWGFNWYADKLPPSGCIIAWDKRVDLPSNSYADVEMAWVNLDKPARVIRHRWFGCVRDTEVGEGRLHPTQKPVKVQATLIEMFSAMGDVVLDLFGGAGSTLLAAHQLGRRCLIAEMSPAYLATILERGKRAGLAADLIRTIPMPDLPASPDPKPKTRNKRPST